MTQSKDNSNNKWHPSPAPPPAQVVAEIGCNHRGEMETAREMIKIAKIFCESDFVKFQKRNPKESVHEDDFNKPHPNPVNSFGDTYGQHREFLEFDLDQHRQLQEFCEEMGIGYSCSVWDLTSAAEIASLNPAHIKIPSACNLFRELLEYLCDHYGGEIHVSLGMTTKEEEELLIRLFEDKKRNQDLVLYACTSGYPVPDYDICLMELVRLREAHQHRVKSIGFSGHHLGIAVDVAAYTLGAEWIERHFTLDRTWKGTDHSASLEPDGMRRVARDVRSISRALTYKSTDILGIEEVQRNKLKWMNSLVSK